MAEPARVAAPQRPRLTEAALQAFVRELVDAVDPVEVILFGSHAYGEPTEASDVDLLLVMETDLPRRERKHAVWEAMGSWPSQIDLHIRTPGEIQRALAIGNFFVREIATRGRVLYARGPLCHPTGATPPLDYSFPLGGEVDEVTDPLAWVERAEGDYAMAISALRRKRPLTSEACFHVQQSIEKYFKAALVSRGQGFPKIHKLVELADLLAGQGIFVPLDGPRLEKLTEYAVATRYPGAEPTVEEARGALDMARAVRRFVRRLIGI